MFLKSTFHFVTPKFSNSPFVIVDVPGITVANPSPLGELKAKNWTLSLFNLAKQYLELPVTFAEFNWKTQLPIPSPDGSNVIP